jgi:tetratricopeptide (TPR) repeat protein
VAVASPHLAEARYYLAIVRLKQGRHAVAVRLLTRAMNSAQQSGDRMRSMAAQIRLGQALIEMGKLDQAHPLLHDAVRCVAADDSPRFRAIALEALGRLHSARGDTDKAAPLLAEAQMLRRALPANAPR